jgi:hypothetical protein
VRPSRETYSCTVERDRDGRVQQIIVDAQDVEHVGRRTSLNGGRAGQVAAEVHDVLRAAGITGRAWSSSRAIELDSVPGAQVELLLRAVKPLRRLDRIGQVAQGVANMSKEEASYWHAKASRPGGLRALRVLLSEGKIR